MRKTLAQVVVEDENGQAFIEKDWYPKPLPGNIEMEEMAYPDTSYSFTTFFSKRKVGFRLGYASGNYGHGTFTTGKNGEINIGSFVVLQCTRIISNLSVTIKDHCMFSWGSVITDSWLRGATFPENIRRKMMMRTANAENRHLEFVDPQPVLIEENVWVGFESVILPGVKIGRGAVIGCKTVVSEEVPPYAVVVGDPARIIKFLEPTDTSVVKQQAIKQFIP